jgi:hypothetical protein
MLGKLAVQIKTSVNDPEQAREIWDLMSKSNATRCDYWLDRITWEKTQENSSVCKDMFKKNIFKVVDDPVRFGYAYLAFLAENGTLDELNIGYSTLRKVFKKHVIVSNISCQVNHSRLLLLLLLLLPIRPLQRPQLPSTLLRLPRSSQ